VETAEVRVVREPPDSELTSQLLGRYFAELASRFPEGFDPEQTVAAPATELEAPIGAFFVAHFQSRPVGCGGVRRLDEITAEIKRMWVDPAVRGRGIGRQLLNALEGAAVELDCRVIRLDTSAHLSQAIGLYRSSGYRDIPAYNENPYAAYWFEKRLG
jgi:GNAT superfamily N-acetyltransferase